MMKLRPAARSRRAAAMPAAPAPTMTQSTSARRAAGRAAPTPGLPQRRGRAGQEASAGNSLGFMVMVRRSWFANGFTLHRDEAQFLPELAASAKSWLTIRLPPARGDEPDRNKSRLNCGVMTRRAGQRRGQNGSRWS